MDDPITKLTSPEGCEQFALNVEARNPELAHAARRRAVELKANAYGAESDAEREAVEAVYAYERALLAKHGRNLKASRTWTMIKRRGLIPAVEFVVTRPADASGFKELAKLGMLDKSFESVVLRHRDVFSAEAIQHAERRLQAWKASSEGNK